MMPINMRVMARECVGLATGTHGTDEDPGNTVTHLTRPRRHMLDRSHNDAPLRCKIHRHFHERATGRIFAARRSPSHIVSPFPDWNMGRSTSLLWRGLRNPGRAWRAVLIRARGWRCKAWCRLRGIRLETGRNFRISGRLVLRGPGRVIFGDNVLIDGVVTPWTYSEDAVISVGSDSYVNGTRFGCQREIRIGERAILGDARILDTDFHSTARNRHDPEAPIRVAPVHIEENVWIAAAVGILPGTTIGRNSVVGFGAVCAGSYPADVIIAGNPAVVIRPIPSDPQCVSDRDARAVER